MKFVIVRFLFTFLSVVENEVKPGEIAAKAVPASNTLAEKPLIQPNETVTKQTVPLLINEDPKTLNATEPQTKPLERSTIPAATEKKSETVKAEVLKPEDVAKPDEEEANAEAEVKAEEAAKPDDVSKAEDDIKVEGKSEVGVKPEELGKNDAGVLDNPELNPGPFDTDSDDDTEKDHPNEKNDGGEMPYRDGDDDDYGEDGMVRNNNIPEVKIPQDPEPTLEDEVPHKIVEIVDFEEDPDSNFFTYLCALMFLCVLLYILHQNRQKILALFLEGRRGNRRGSRDRSRGGSKAAYSKLDCNLEEAIMSKKSLSGKSMDIIY